MKIIFSFLCLLSVHLNAQYWQQKADYVMDIEMDMETYQYQGSQEIVYKNNSPETLTKVYYHLYNNAFQPGSAMDVKIQNMKDPDPRVVVNTGTENEPVNKSRIALLQPEEQGYIKVLQLSQNGRPLKYHVEGTILEVELAKPIKSGRKARLEMEFKGQVPLQVRRSGRNNKEGIALSMTQWYPKLAAYDDEGWHANPYLGAEFYADWGDYEVNITIDKEFTIGGSGYLQNPQEIGCGYENSNKKLKEKIVNGKKTWKFKAPNVHDFSWAADMDYKHIVHEVVDGPTVHFLYKNSLNLEVKKSWEKLPAIIGELFNFYKEQVGAYPYKQYTIVQGGDGGMEYAMCTLITGDRTYRSLVGVVAHELAHSWFQFLLASNETKHAWMDEGFTTYISTLIENFIFKEEKDAFEKMYASYVKLTSYNIEQSLNTHGDAFDYNYGYGISSYNKGALFLYQLKYIIGEDALKKTLKNYFKEFSFKHPKPENFIRIAEKNSGIELDWYLNFWIASTATIDYEVFPPLTNTITLHRKSKMVMPIEVMVTYEDEVQESFYIPLDIMRGEKEQKGTLLPDWSWIKPTYSFSVEKSIKKIEIVGQIADVDKKTNIWEHK